MSFQKIPSQIRRQNLYENLNLAQLIELSKINKQTNSIIEPFIKKRKKKLFLTNYTLLYHNLFHNTHRSVLNNIYKSYGSKKLFLDFLYNYIKLRGKNKAYIEMNMIELDKKFRLCNNLELYNIFIEFANSQKFKNLNRSVPL